MYPDFQYFLESVFNTEMPEWLGIFKIFGFFVAMAFIAAAYTLVRELKRKEEQGLIFPQFKSIEVGKPASVNELLWSALSGFIIGYKIAGVYGNTEHITPDPLGYLFSLQGNVLGGIIGALLLGYIKYAEKKKQQLPEPQVKKIAIHPHERVMEILMLAALGGFVGAKIFNALETWEDFIRNPAESLLSSSGFTFYGGLIVATLTIYFYSRKHKIGFSHLCDATAPGLILAYGIGRFGCHFAGDGDWGIFNSAYITAADGSLQHATLAEFQTRLHDAAQYFGHNYGSLANVPHSYAPAPSLLPDWMFAMNYAHNVNHDGVRLADCASNYCTVLPAGVFPTSVYEAVVCIGLFFVLWSLRKRLTYPWQMFGLYLMFNGIERFFIEKIRVNFKYDWGFIHPTQAEIISTILFLIGLALFTFRRKKNTEIVSEKVN
jgi:phosphatidylglycerol:prolipoprotein diacylglycerol transferase